MRWKEALGRVELKERIRSVDWKLFLLALLAATVLSVLIRTSTAYPADKTPKITIVRPDGHSETILLLCDEMNDMIETTKREGLLRQAAAESCGEDTDPRCMPYYIQYRVVSDFYLWLKLQISRNCAVH